MWDTHTSAGRRLERERSTVACITKNITHTPRVTRARRETTMTKFHRRQRQRENNNEQTLTIFKYNTYAGKTRKTNAIMRRRECSVCPEQTKGGKEKAGQSRKGKLFLLPIYWSTSWLGQPHHMENAIKECVLCVGATEPQTRSVCLRLLFRHTFLINLNNNDGRKETTQCKRQKQKPCPTKRAGFELTQERSWAGITLFARSLARSLSGVSLARFLAMAHNDVMC